MGLISEISCCSVGFFFCFFLPSHAADSSRWQGRDAFKVSQIEQETWGLLPGNTSAAHPHTPLVILVQPSGHSLFKCCPLVHCPGSGQATRPRLSLAPQVWHHPLWLLSPGMSALQLQNLATLAAAAAAAQNSASPSTANPLSSNAASLGALASPGNTAATQVGGSDAGGRGGPTPAYVLRSAPLPLPVLSPPPSSPPPWSQHLTAITETINQPSLPKTISIVQISVSVVDLRSGTAPWCVYPPSPLLRPPSLIEKPCCVVDALPTYLRPPVFEHFPHFLPPPPPPTNHSHPMIHALYMCARVHVCVFRAYMCPSGSDLCSCVVVIFFCVCVFFVPFNLTSSRDPRRPLRTLDLLLLLSSGRTGCVCECVCLCVCVCWCFVWLSLAGRG